MLPPCLCAEKWIELDFRYQFCAVLNQIHVIVSYMYKDMCMVILYN